MKTLTTVLVLVTFSSCGQSRKSGWTDEKYSRETQVVSVQCSTLADDAYCKKASDCVVDYIAANYEYSFYLSHSYSVLKVLYQQDVFTKCINQAKQ